MEVDLDETEGDNNNFVVVPNKEDNYFIRNCQNQAITVPKQSQDTIKDFPY